MLHTSLVTRRDRAAALAALFVCLFTGYAAAQVGPTPSGPAPAEFVELVNRDLGPGTVLRPAGFDLTEPGAAWQNQLGAAMVYEQFYDDYGCYRMDFTLGDGIRGLWTLNRAPMKPNRRYTVSALIRANFDRAQTEINLGFRSFDPQTNFVRAGEREAGVPAITEGPDGWEVWEWSFVTPSVTELPSGALTLWIYVNPGSGPVEFRMADFVAIERPVEAAAAFAPGEGVTFRGGPGPLPMSIDSVATDGDTLTVEVTAARYEFDRVTGVVRATQLVAPERPVAEFAFGDRLGSLSPVSSSATEVVLVSDDVTVGVQMDGVMVVTPHEGVDLRMTATSLIAAPMTRFARGHLYVKDDFGGFTVNPLPPTGSGRVPAAQALDATLDFLSFGEVDNESLSTEPAGWSIAWDIEPGDRMFISIFPPRPYDWDKSFTDIWFWTFETSPIPSYETNRPFVNQWGMWDFSNRAWAMSYATEYTPTDEALLIEHVQTIQAQGDTAFPYMSAWFHRTRDPEVFVGEVERWMATYGIDGIYSDGLPAVEWLVAYEQMRMLRELVGDGPLVIHDSVPQSGRSISMFQPFVFTYATHSYMGEGTPTTSGPNWPWARYVISQYANANTFGAIKGDAWNNAQNQNLGVERDLATLVFGGRASPGTVGYVEQYLPALAALQTQWQTYGDAVDYYNQYFLPYAQELTGLQIGRSGAPIATRERTGLLTDTVTLDLWTDGGVVRYTTDGSEPTNASLLYVEPIVLPCTGVVRAMNQAAGLEQSVAIRVESLASCCAADLTGDGIVNVLDVVEFIVVWGAMDPVADLDENGTYNVLDVVAFIQIWNLGC